VRQLSLLLLALAPLGGAAVAQLAFAPTAAARIAPPAVSSGPSAGPAASVVRFAGGAAARVAPAAGPHSVLQTPDGSLDVAVETYGDCSGEAPLTHAAAAIDTCITGLTYFIGHNPGVFTPLMRLGVASKLYYFDAGGRPHHLQVIAARTWLRDAGVPPPVRSGEAAQFQTCVTADGSVDRILDAVEV
jgi:hypothetical protein